MFNRIFEQQSIKSLILSWSMFSWSMKKFDSNSSSGNLAKKESRLKFYRMSFALHSIDICIFFMLQTVIIFSNISLKYENK